VRVAKGGPLRQKKEVYAKQTTTLETLKFGAIFAHPLLSNPNVSDKILPAKFLKLCQLTFCKILANSIFRFLFDSIKIPHPLLSRATPLKDSGPWTFCLEGGPYVPLEAIFFFIFYCRMQKFLHFLLPEAKFCLYLFLFSLGAPFCDRFHN
jgi:hypothetical protein